MRRVLLLCALVSVGLVAVPTSVGATAPLTPAAALWTLQHPVSLARWGGDSLAGVDCTALGACIAVGTRGTASGGDVALAEAWNGSTWALQSVPDPTHHSAAGLASVSCASKTACTAVGTYTSKVTGTDLPLAERWDGSSWSLEPVPLPTGATLGSLRSVSCTSTSACVAVGFDSASGLAEAVPMAVSWDGSVWAPLPDPPLPSGETAAQLNGVSCQFSTCMAVGIAFDSAGDGTPMSDFWNSATWYGYGVPLPASAVRGGFFGVSCASSSVCSAVGGTTTGGGQESSLAESWTDTTWTIEPTPNPAGASEDSLSSVSCPEALNCEAVGSSVDTAIAFAEHWNGSVWKLEHTPEPARDQSRSLQAVECVGPGVCEAVGSHEYQSAPSTDVEGSVAEERR